MSCTTPDSKNVEEEFDVEKILETHPAFATAFDSSVDDPGFAGLQALKYESEDPDANAQSYKDEGNYHYGRNEFKMAIDSYTGGIRAKPIDKELLAILHTNRAICHWHLQNFGSCIRDCKVAISLNPKHVKAYVKGAQASLSLSKIDTCLEFCERGLEQSPDLEQLIQFQLKALKEQVKNDRITNSLRGKHQRHMEKKALIYRLVQDHGVNINFKLPPVTLPETVGSQPYKDESNMLHWPVLLMYPEFGQTDFLRDVIEKSKVIDCLQTVFNPNEPPATWNLNQVYTCQDDSLEVYFEDSLKAQRLVNFTTDTSIKSLTRRKDFCVRRDLLIVIHVISKKSPKFYERWKAELM
ncbi:putative heat shock protein 70 (Hsp70)-interacting protein [Fasciolopsis buskii]|uniref:Putative heat shock protein 70 (Hsp70)-interacting protein n=1 Tax=Fasciolopsis buskii TaxID=27845 RepID=A0A8E0S118_9TREM|nr:putative heat shock protein 70 (Hsp70)-interacting protein [Fasciolopsis buski]